MNKSPLTIKLSMLPLAALVAFSSTEKARAQTDGSWLPVAGGSWATATNWTGGTVAAGAGALADFSLIDINATRTITLDGSRTLGILRFGDTGTVSNDQVLNTGTAGSILTLDVASGKAEIQVLNRTATIGAVIAGDDGIKVFNDSTVNSTLILGAANTFSGGLDIEGVIVQLNNSAGAGAAGVNEIMLHPSASASRLTLNSGVSNASSIRITGNLKGVAGFGAIHYTGTGTSTLSGPIQLDGRPDAGGHFTGGNSTGNSLILNGPITTSDPAMVVSHRLGFIRYGGGGTGYNGLLVTDTAQVGATDGIATTANVQLGGSGNAILDLNNFDQRLASVLMGFPNSANLGTINLGARNLTLDGDLTMAPASAAISHTVNATAGGKLTAGAAGTHLVVEDNPGLDDLVINNAALEGTGGFVKQGEGTLSLVGSSGSGSLSLESGFLSIGRAGVPGTFSIGSLKFPGSGGTLLVDAGSSGDVATVGEITATGSNKIILNQIGGILPAGTYPILNYTGTTPGLGSFSLQPVGHSTSSLIDTGSSIALKVTENKRVTWDGTNSSLWTTNVTGNWKMASGAGTAVTDYIESDDVIFPPAAVSKTVNIQDAPVNPSLMTVETASAADYTFTGDFGINGGTSLIKNGNGKLTLNTSNRYLGATTLSAGTLELDHDTPDNGVLTGSSGVSLADGTALILSRDDGAFNFTRKLTGSGSLTINPHQLSGSAAVSVGLSGDNSGFSGPILLQTPAGGTWRINSPQPAALGTGAITVEDGAQVFTTGALTFNNPITISGSGFTDSGGNIGALRLDFGAIWAGPVTITAGGATIGSHNSTGTITGSISGGDLTANATNFNNSCTLILSGANSYGSTTIGGLNFQSSGVPSMRLNIGANGTTGTLGKGPVTINGDGANGILGFDRTDGYTLGAGQTLTGAGSNPARTFLDVDTRGTGLNQAGNAIILGAAEPAFGGQVRVAQGRAGSIFNVDGALVAESIRVSTGQTGGTVNFKSGAVVDANFLSAGEAANAGGTINQLTGSTVNVKGQVRAGHWGTETSVYNMEGGSLNLTGESPALTPSTSASGGAGATGDANINAQATPVIEGGGIYLGIDGTGIFNHNGGNVSTNWIVLDNRGNTGTAANMPTGIDQYNLKGGTLSLRSSWGILQRNVSAEVNLSGGTIKIDNTGTGTGTGAALTVPIDAGINVSGTTAVLDTNGAANSFSLPRNILGTGSLALNGGGKYLIGGTAPQLIEANLSGVGALQKTGAGTTSITGAGAAYTGAITVAAGRLDLPSTIAPASVSVASGTSLSGEPSTASLTVDSGTILFDPTTTGALTAGALNISGTVLLDFSSAPLADGTYTAIKYTTKTGSGTFAVTGAGNYRSVTVNDTGSAITVTLGGTKALVWNGTGSSDWDIKATVNWNDAAPAANQFFLGDSVSFTDAATQTSVPVSAGVAPSSTMVNSSKNYTFTSAGSGIGGGGSLTKDGTGTLTLSGTNSYSGSTRIKGGILAISAAGSLGDGGEDNDILIEGGARFNYTGATAVDFGLNRDLIIGSGGGFISHSNATAAALTFGGDLSGTASLSFQSQLAGAGTFNLNGDNSGYSGAITVDAPATGTGGLTVLRLAGPQAAPSGGSITLNFPAGAANGNATTLDLANTILPAAVGLNFTSQLNGTTTLRTQLTSSGDSAVKGPVSLAGSSIIQFSLAAGTMSLDGPITEDPAGFTGTFFIRGGGGTGILNGKVTLPTGTFAKTDANSWVLNSTGNRWANGILAVGGITLGADDALDPNSPLVLGQNDANTASLNLNGFDQTLNGLASNPTTAGANTTGKNITSATPALLTVASDNSTTYASLITGSVSVLKKGAGTLTLAGANTTIGNYTIDDGTLIAGGGVVTSLGSPTTAGRVITVNAPGLLNFTTNNVYGNGVNNANLPSTVVNASILDSTRYNVLGDLTLNNAASLIQSASDSGAYEGFQFRGAVNATGTGLNTISSAGKANHLGPDTVFNVADTVAGAGTDLLVSTILRNQSGDFGQAAGGLTKTGGGSLELTEASIYSGPTAVSGGSLRVSNTAGSATGTGPVNVNAGGILTGEGEISGLTTVNAGGFINPGDGPGMIFTGDTVLNGNSGLAWEVTNWTGAAGADWDYLRVNGSLAINATAAAPVVIRVSQVSLTNFSAANKSFLLASANGGITGFSASAFTVDPTSFSAGNGSWSVSQSGGDLYLNYSAAGAVPPYDAWATAHGLAGAAAVPSADPDNDGRVNLAEFATNGNPKSGLDSGKMRVAVATIGSQRYLTLTLPVRTGVSFSGGTEQSGTGSGIRYRIQGDTSLNTWDTVITEVSPALAADLPALETGWIYRTFRTAVPITAGTRHFLRGKFETLP